MKKYLLTSLLFIISLCIDIITKYLVVISIPEYEIKNILGDFIQFTLVYNEGGIFSILQGYQTFFLSLSIVVLTFIIIFFILRKNKSNIFCISIALIASGAMGNILDRIIGRKGVVDFISIGIEGVYRWATFNTADAAIVTGAVLLFIEFYKEEKRNKSEKK